MPSKSVHALFLLLLFLHPICSLKCKQLKNYQSGSFSITERVLNRTEQNSYQVNLSQSKRVDLRGSFIIDVTGKWIKGFVTAVQRLLFVELVLLSSSHLGRDRQGDTNINTNIYYDRDNFGYSNIRLIYRKHLFDNLLNAINSVILKKC